MKNYFFTEANKEKELLDWGSTTRLSGPKLTEAKDLLVIEVELLPRMGHDFHKHPNQEEVIYVLEGIVEQWVGQEKRILKSGDSAFIPAAMVHASFNTSDTDTAKVMAILGPCVGEEAYEIVEVHTESPWRSLRK